MPQIKKGKYKHFKGTIVEVIGTVLHSKTMQELVIYLHPDPRKRIRRKHNVGKVKRNVPRNYLKRWKRNATIQVHKIKHKTTHLNST